MRCPFCNSTDVVDLVVNLRLEFYGDDTGCLDCERTWLAGGRKHRGTRGRGRRVRREP